MRRKANGKQEEYEDKVKAVKKAELQAKKSVLRIEDTARGVFVPVDSLPKADPQKVKLPAQAVV